MSGSADSAVYRTPVSGGPEASPRPLALGSLLLLLLVAVAAVIVLLETTRQGIGLRGDSLAYIGGARNIDLGLGFSRVSGGGEVKAIAHFPPLYSFVLAGTSLFGSDPLDTARVLNALLFGLNAALCGLIVWKATRSVGFALLAAFLFGSNKTMIDLHAWAMSEGLYITFIFTFLILLDQYLLRPSRLLAVLIGLVAGLGFLTRYVGASLVALGVLALLFLRRERKHRIVDLGLLITAWMLPVVPWLARNAAQAGTPTNRRLMWHPLEAAKVQEGIASFWSWLLPDKVRQAVAMTNEFLTALSVVLIAALGAYLVFGWLRRRRVGMAPSGSQPFGNLDLLLAGSVLVYLATVTTSLYLFDASTPLDYRILSPIYVAILPLLVVALSWLWSLRARLAKASVAGLAIILMLASVDDAVDVVRSYRFHGIGLNAVRWRQSETLQAIRDLSPSVIYTNEWDLVYFQTGRTSYPIFNRFDAVTFQNRPNYDEWLEAANRGLQQEGAVLVLFGETWDGELSANDREMIDGLTKGLSMFHEYADGMIYRRSP